MSESDESEKSSDESDQIQESSDQIEEYTPPPLEYTPPPSESPSESDRSEKPPEYTPPSESPSESDGSEKPPEYTPPPKSGCLIATANLVPNFLLRYSSYAISEIPKLCQQSQVPVL